MDTWESQLFKINNPEALTITERLIVADTLKLLTIVVIPVHFVSSHPRQRRLTTYRLYLTAKDRNHESKRLVEGPNEQSKLHE